MANRSRRVNAGNRLIRLLQEEDVDDFYKTTYGGFQDADEDNDYEQGAEGEDEVDSDFSIDENDEPVSDHGDEEKKKRRKPGAFTKVYKDPGKSKPKETPDIKIDLTPKVKVKKPTESTPDGHIERKSIRKSTADKSAETKQRMKIRNQLMKDKVKKSNVDDRMPSQEELLAEAVTTEIDNIKSLERFERLELEKKITRPTKRAFNGPLIRYHSFTVNPLLVDNVSAKVKKTNPIKDKKDSVIDDKKNDSVKDLDMDILDIKAEATENEDEDKVNVIPDFSESKIDTDNRISDLSDANNDLENPKPLDKDGIGTKYERTLITFLNDIKDKAFKSAFPVSKRPKPKSKMCAVTKLPAKYFDPVTNLPYSSIEAFKILREAYYQQLEARGNRARRDVSKWISWRVANRKARQLQTIAKLM
ncbi:vacuolar protein sorting-associated protein YL-1 isoform X2 [Arctopsyche grandis]|uniref:vacuolar protein sorting-associated protein YL-1 isoform X2 n=1 Tax=Arctopsyche grandis TaxID=121162 RepID=UPI00406D74FE